MGNISIILRLPALVLLVAILFVSAIGVRAQNRPARKAHFTISALKGLVEVSREGAQTFDKVDKGAPLYVGDRVRVGPDSDLAIKDNDQNVYTFESKSAFVVPTLKPGATGGPRIRLLSGLLYFLHRGKAGFFEVETRTASAAVRGTEFHLAVDDAGVTVITMIDGLVDLKNEVDTVAVKSGEQGIAEPGKAPVVRPAIDVIHVIQWTLYYPAILDADEIPFTEADREALSSSLKAYRSGDLLRALNEYPAGRTSISEAETLYLAGLKLAVSQVDEAHGLLRNANGETQARLAAALRAMINAVKGTTTAAESSPILASEWMAESYRLQARADLIGALQAARNATAKSPQFGFGWSRVAELEFSFGRIDAAAEVIGKALEISPRNAQAVALNGFLLAARNQMKAAISSFDRAIEIDPGLANGWLGRGLCLIRTGETERGREDLLMAAAQEPNRAFLRSYLGKAWADDGEVKLAEDELKLAKVFDPRDPTAWLYAALLKAQNNRINEAIRELEHAQTLNTNRAVYRSDFLLDQDRAVRSVNLAKIHRDAGMTDWSVREAGRAVTADYGNYSAHLFLANSYDQLQDPYRINLRYETATESEYLIANLLAPVGAGVLSQSVSQGEYSSLFERNRFGVASTTEYLSRGAWYENGAQFGILGNTAYSIEGIYRNDPGQRANNDFEERDLRFQIKQQLTYKDSVLFRAGWLERSGGDLRQLYDSGAANPTLRTRQRQEPALTVGYHREWNPGMHTLLVASRLDDSYRVDNPAQSLFFTIPSGQEIIRVEPLTARQEYRSRLDIYSVEAQQIWQGANNSLAAGARFQRGDIDTYSWQGDLIATPTGWAKDFIPPGKAYEDAFETPFERLTAYAYEQLQIANVIVIGGLTYDRIRHPVNHRAAPISDAVKTGDQISPKAGFVWFPFERSIVRGAYSRSLNGASIDQSLTIEPSQVAGFNQSFRSLVPESVVGSDVGAELELFGLSLEHAFETRTDVSISGEVARSDNIRALGAIALDSSGTDQGIQSLIHENIQYRERILQVTADQLMGRYLSAGVKYRLSNSRLDDSFQNIADNATVENPFRRQTTMKATLHQLNIHGNWNHPAGFFTYAEANRFAQYNNEYLSSFADDEFWQMNLLAGYRFLQRRAEIAVGILNITDQNYNLHPLTPYLELPRERTFLVRARLAF